MQKNLEDKGITTIFADFFGVASVDDVSARLARAVFAVTRSRESLWNTALREIKSFRPILKPDAEGGLSLSVEPSSSGRRGLPLLEDTMESLGDFIRSMNASLHIALDEFQEIVSLRGALQIEAVLRTHIQQQQASYFFIGSRRRVLLGIFNERQRPFFQSAINYELKKLPTDDLVQFLTAQFARGGKSCPASLAAQMAALVEDHPYYIQKLAFFIYELSDEEITPASVSTGMERLIISETPVFEAITQGLSSQQRLLLRALAQEPTAKLLAAAYLQKHDLGSVGGIQHATKNLADLDLIEKDRETGKWRLVDPVLPFWIKRQFE